jgi:lysyl-tRNA synthetase class 1
MRYSPDRHIDYDPGMGIIDSVDEYDHIETLYYDGGADDKEKDLLRAYELAQPECARPKKPLQVPYRHLVSLVQMAPDTNGVLDIIMRTEDLAAIGKEDRAVLEQRCGCVRHWLDNFAPDDVKFSIAATMPAVELNEDEKRFLGTILPALEKVDWHAAAIHDAVHGTATGMGIPAKVAFGSLYKILIGKKQGPRLGYFLSTMERAFVVGRVREAL